MNVRELLRHEIWSTRTTWKILIVSAVVLISGYGILRGYELYWITSGVRESGRTAFEQIEELQELSTSCDEAGFKTNAESADSEIRIAEERVHTYRDIEIMSRLTDYLMSVRISHLWICRQSSTKRFEEKNSQLRDLYNREAQLRQRLHKELD
jgi:hypothetical protein